MELIPRGREEQKEARWSYEDEDDENSKNGVRPKEMWSQKGETGDDDEGGGSFRTEQRSLCFGRDGLFPFATRGRQMDVLMMSLIPCCSQVGLGETKEIEKLLSQSDMLQ